MDRTNWPQPLPRVPLRHPSQRAQAADDPPRRPGPWPPRESPPIRASLDPAQMGRRPGSWPHRGRRPDNAVVVDIPITPMSTKSMSVSRTPPSLATSSPSGSGEMAVVPDFPLPPPGSGAGTPRVGSAMTLGGLGTADSMAAHSPFSPRESAAESNTPPPIERLNPSSSRDVATPSSSPSGARALPAEKLSPSRDAVVDDRRITIAVEDRSRAVGTTPMPAYQMSPYDGRGAGGDGGGDGGGGGIGGEVTTPTDEGMRGGVGMNSRARKMMMMEALMRKPPSAGQRPFVAAGEGERYPAASAPPPHSHVAPNQVALRSDGEDYFDDDYQGHIYGSDSFEAESPHDASGVPGRGRASNAPPTASGASLGGSVPEEGAGAGAGAGAGSAVAAPGQGKPEGQMSLMLTDTKPVLACFWYGIQHFVSLFVSLVLLPHIVVPAMGGDEKDLAKVISTTLLVTGISTLLQTTLGSRLPLVQGMSFAYLMPILLVAAHHEKKSGAEGKLFEETMRAVQGGVIASSVVQMILGATGLLSLLLRFISPVVVSATMATIGLTFVGKTLSKAFPGLLPPSPTELPDSSPELERFRYGFPAATACSEVGLVQIGVVLIFMLYLRKVELAGSRVFRIYAMPFGLVIVWVYAMVLTLLGTYDYNCDDGKCSNEQRLRKSYCGTSNSTTLDSVKWIDAPYPWQWGTPTFHPYNIFMMLAGTLVSILDSVSSYYASSRLSSTHAPPRGVVSRGILVEGFCTLLAGLFGTGAGSTTLAENVYIMGASRVGSRHAVEFGAGVLVIISFCGKVGGLMAIIPKPIVGGLLCIAFVQVISFALLNLKFVNVSNPKNMTVMALALYAGFAIPQWVTQTSSQGSQYDRPIQLESSAISSVMNAYLGMPMLVALSAALLLDNTVPGSKDDRGVYQWAHRHESKEVMDSLCDEYALPFGLGRYFQWARCTGM
ncbi:hypothetical protein CBR_g206 [Chara braunii]|uniref:Uncharacterized protein n=1 Tax=Chara braunii TaxID=69332 RepID=A0A388JLW5_CHABU|nr:hypothetical protein CBR_g206 [Chara braunii]|eukprot:GBG58806.1 hypothetical protein CBR_g206 [Chara braunii]